MTRRTRCALVSLLIGHGSAGLVKSIENMSKVGDQKLHYKLKVPVINKHNEEKIVAGITFDFKTGKISGTMNLDDDSMYLHCTKGKHECTLTVPIDKLDKEEQISSDNIDLRLGAHLVKKTVDIRDGEVDEVNANKRKVKDAYAPAIADKKVDIVNKKTVSIDEHHKRKKPKPKSKSGQLQITAAFSFCIVTAVLFLVL